MGLLKAQSVLDFLQSLSQITKCLLDTAAFARQEYTSLAEIVFLISVQNQTFSVPNKQNVQSHLLLSSV